MTWLPRATTIARHHGQHARQLRAAAQQSAALGTSTGKPELGSSRAGAVSLTWAPAARAIGAVAMAAAVALSSSSVRKNKQDSPRLSSMLGRDRPKNLGLSIFLEIPVFEIGIFLNWF